MADTDYDRIARLLGATELSASPAEAQGLLCGLICGGDPDARGTWMRQLIEDTEAQPGTDLLRDEGNADLKRVADRAFEEIEGPGMGLTFLLPDETRPLVERATAVYDWVRGFLFALGLLGVSEADLSPQTREIFSDFTDLTRMDLDAVEDDEESEDALIEITEFIWVAAMLVYEERVAGPAELAAKRAGTIQ